jgi:NAD(P)-dependent dehydrogenase (short-subunit alcohol dehydrogenase family)
MGQKTEVNRRELFAGAAALTGAAAIAGSAAAQGAAPDLSGKSVLITGSSSGFGRLAAEHFARSGANVIASMRNLKGGKRAEAQELTDIASKDKLKLTVVEIDVTRDEQVAAGVAKAEKIAGGALDAVLNNAGIGVGGPAELYDITNLQRAFDVNFFGYQRVARAALPKMRARREGLLVQISSQLGRLVLPNIGAYCATKFAVEAMFEAMAYELAPFGVEATIIQPGGYPTKIWTNGARYFEELLESADEERKAAYSGHIELANGLLSGAYQTDAMDVPRAIAAIIALPPGSRPLRKPVHPNTQASDALNAAHKQVQAAVMGQGSYKAWHDAVTD